jgi:hypothetical protein
VLVPSGGLRSHLQGRRSYDPQNAQDRRAPRLPVALHACSVEGPCMLAVRELATRPRQL